MRQALPEETAALTVRRALPEEAAVVHRIMLEAFAEYRGALPVESGAHTETVSDVRAVMERGGAVLAMAADEPVGSARYVLEPDALYVGRVAVLPSHRRRGVASAMMRFLEELAPTLSRTVVRLGVRDSLPSNVALYQALGYTVAHVDKHARGDDRVWTMVKRVPNTHA